MITTAQQIDVHIKWIIRRDMPAVLAIEKQCFEFPWLEEDFIRCLRQRNAIAIAAEVNEQIVGFAVYELHKHHLHVLDFAVHEDWRFKGVGRAMVQKLIGKLSHDRRSRIVLEVRDSNLEAQLFFRRMGFRCTGVMREFYEDCDDDAYQFVYRHDGGCSGA